jgi:hypothetical protein
MMSGNPHLTGDTKLKSVLVIGIYLTDKDNNASQIVAELSSSHGWNVDQRWIGLGQNNTPSELESVTCQHHTDMVPKFTLINRILNQVNLSDYEYLVICDDDIALPSQFLDNYLALVGQYRFAIAQPARTNDSYIDHQFVGQLHGIKARRTRFVEIGPVFSFHKHAFAACLPFDEESPMGWGYDFVWPHLADKNGLNMGIVDATPMTHKMRPPVANYSYAKANSTMHEYLSKRAHLTLESACYILESYA